MKLKGGVHNGYETINYICRLDTKEENNTINLKYAVFRFYEVEGCEEI